MSKSSLKLIKIAITVLTNNKSSKISKRLAGSVLSQASPDNSSSATMQKMASKTLKSKKYSIITKTLAGSVLSQTRKPSS